MLRKKRSSDSSKNCNVLKKLLKVHSCELQNTRYRESASTWSILSVFILDTFCQCIFRHLLCAGRARNALFEFAGIFTLQKLNICKPFTKVLALNWSLLKCTLFIHTWRLSCLSKICPFHIASLNRYSFF